MAGWQWVFTDDYAGVVHPNTSWEDYAVYAVQIRKEYGVYPDVLYKPGRRKVLQRFLEPDFIFKTVDFRKLLELQARNNIQQEILALQ